MYSLREKGTPRNVMLELSLVLREMNLKKSLIE